LRNGKAITEEEIEELVDMVDKIPRNKKDE
jgi:hypothetical protein